MYEWNTQELPQVAVEQYNVLYSYQVCCITGMYVPVVVTVVTLTCINSYYCSCYAATAATAAARCCWCSLLLPLYMTTAATATAAAAAASVAQYCCSTTY